MNKRAMFFTILVISMLSLFLVSITIHSTFQNREPIHKRIKTMNNFVFSVEEDLPRKLYISAFRIIFLFEKRIAETGNYITDLNDTFEELFFEGTIYGEANVDVERLMEKSTYSGIQDSLNERAETVNVDINLSEPEISILQVDPWNIKVILKTELLIRDFGNLSLWNRTAVIEAYVPIKNFEDPLYLVNTNGQIINIINQTIYEPFVDGGDVTNFNLHLSKHLYKSSVSGPSFLDRLEGNTDPNDNGIESLVYIPDMIPLIAQGIPVKDKSVVDYVYFDDTKNPDTCTIPGMPSWFQIHNAGDYGAGGIAVC